jgi:acyl carrier protein
MTEQIRQRVIEIISNLNKISKEDIDPTISFRDVGMDSFSLVEAVFSIENEYDITFEQDALMNIVTVNELVAYIATLLEKEKS